MDTIDDFDDGYPSFRRCKPKVRYHKLLQNMHQTLDQLEVIFGDDFDTIEELQHNCDDSLKSIDHLIDCAAIIKASIMADNENKNAKVEHETTIGN